MKTITPNERQEIAEWCGWKQVTLPSGREAWLNPAGAERDHCPVYGKLDSCAEFEAVVKERGGLCRDQYTCSLCNVAVTAWGKPLIAGDLEFIMATAEPAQRVTAILKVIREAKI